MAEDDDGLPTTIGELGRLIRGLAKEVRDDRRSYLAVQVWEVERRAMDERDRAKGREIAQLRTKIDNMDTEKEHEHKELTHKIAAVRDAGAAEIQKLTDKNVAQAEQARKDRAKVWVAIGLAALGGVIAVITGVATAALNQAFTGGG